MKHRERRMTTALIGLPAGREHSQIAAKIEPVINEAMVKKFVAYLDVSEITLKKYEYCLKTFLDWLKTEGITDPLRNDIVRYKNAAAVCKTSSWQEG